MSATTTQTLPAICLSGKVVLPHLLIPVDIASPEEIAGVEDALDRGMPIVVLHRREDAPDRPPELEDVHPMACVSNIVQHVAPQGRKFRILLEGSQRAQVLEIEPGTPPTARVEMVPEPKLTSKVRSGAQTLAKKAASLFQQYVKLHPTPPNDNVLTQLDPKEPSRTADVVAAHLSIPIGDRQRILEIIDPIERLEHILGLLEIEIEKFQLDRKISTRVKKQMDRAQREYYLNEKIKAIHKELGRKDDRADELEQLSQRIEEAKMPEEAKARAAEELRRLEQMPPVSAEATVSRNYLQWLLDVPWHRRSRGTRDIGKAEKILEADHHGLHEVKERILEYLAVRNLVREPRGSILCLVGPPGVGKTSLARSVARATGRKYVRLSLGGIRDEAEIRGHRRTYIGAFPGQIIQMMKKAGTVNPVFLLDEVDKVGADFRGDPTAALLEVLDPEQNHTFMDHYLDVPYDLSQVMFLATANVLHTISPALLDRLEILQIPSYTPQEKREIARGFLLPRSIANHGLKEANLELTDDALVELIDRYTREAGVRGLEREIGKLCRKVARRVCADGRDVRVEVETASLGELLGPPRYHRSPPAGPLDIGTATGLAWTETGGQLLLVECTLMEGKGKLTLTGKMGEVMQESAQAALSYVRAQADTLGIDRDFHRTHDIHIHLPEGAIPKDGPSAGITLTTALVSRLTRCPVRGDVAMTGEITLRGKILPVGGVREKLLAAYRAGLKTVYLPAENSADLEKLTPDVREELQVKLVSHLDEVLPEILEVPNPEEDSPPPLPLPHDPASPSPTQPELG